MANLVYDKYYDIIYTNIKDYIRHFVSDIDTYKVYIKDNNIEYDFYYIYVYDVIKDNEVFYFVNIKESNDKGIIIYIIGN